MQNAKKTFVLLLIAVNFISFQLVWSDEYDCLDCLTIESFRPEKSFQETFHNKIVECLSDFQVNNIDDATSQLEDLYNQANEQIEHFDSIRSEDKEYLLAMIERINGLIKDLERKHHGSVVRLKEICSYLENFFY
jgi:hypothetical protein